MAQVLGIDRGGLLKLLILDPELQLPETVLRDFAELSERRAKGEPAAYILGCKEFYGRDFSVNPDVLIPRPETEQLIDMALAHACRLEEYGRGNDSAKRARRFADFGTGTGCIAVTLALELPTWRGVALDKSPAALAVARANAARLGADNLSLLLADFREPPLLPASLDMLLSNPPYVSEAEYRDLSAEVRDFEPKSALVPCLGRTGTAPLSFAGASGLEDAASLIALAAILLKPGGLLLMEIGCAQSPALLALLNDPLWAEVQVHRDLAGLDRVIAAQRTAA